MGVFRVEEVYNFSQPDDLDQYDNYIHDVFSEVSTRVHPLYPVPIAHFCPFKSSRLSVECGEVVSDSTVGWLSDLGDYAGKNSKFFESFVTPSLCDLDNTLFLPFPATVALSTCSPTNFDPVLRLRVTFEAKSVANHCV